MDNRTLSNHLLPESVFERYTLLVMQHLDGSLDHNTFLRIPQEYRDLINARQFMRNEKFKLARNILANLLKSSDVFIKGECYFILGLCSYSEEMFLDAKVAYTKSQEQFLKVKLLNKALLAEYNVAQCILRLGNYEKSQEIEAKVLHFALEAGIFNIVGLCLRSKGYDCLRKGKFKEASLNFEEAKRILVNMNNRSDALLCLYYKILAEIKVGASLKQISNELASHNNSFVNYRSHNFYQVLIKILAGNNFQKELDKCDSDIRHIVSKLFSNKKRIDVQASKRGSRLGDRLVDFLKNNNGASADECVQYLWGFTGIEKSIKQRLWTLISRINKELPIIYVDENNKYKVY